MGCWRGHSSFWGARGRVVSLRQLPHAPIPSPHARGYRRLHEPLPWQWREVTSERTSLGVPAWGHPETPRRQLLPCWANTHSFPLPIHLSWSTHIPHKIRCHAFGVPHPHSTTVATRDVGMGSNMLMSMGTYHRGTHLVRGSREAPVLMSLVWEVSSRGRRSPAPPRLPPSTHHTQHFQAVLLTSLAPAPGIHPSDA